MLAIGEATSIATPFQEETMEIVMSNGEMSIEIIHKKGKTTSVAAPFQRKERVVEDMDSEITLKREEAMPDATLLLENKDVGMIIETETFLKKGEATSAATPLLLKQNIKKKKKF